jgi:beta-N-acetylhexosaminidase
MRQKSLPKTKEKIVVTMLHKKSVKLGLEKILDEKIDILENLRVGLICNQASVNHQFEHAADLFFENPNINLTTLFGPQHGIRGEVQDNMVETSHTIDKQTNLPIYSLYSETRKPTEEMLENVDAIVFDLQDVGCRVYTFIYTMANAMKACAKHGKKFIVCDRPNPINGVDIEGNLLEIGHESFVGMYPIPMRHGLTVSELALLFNKEFNINCELEVVTMENWERSDFCDETDAPWVLPSPNIPTVDTAIVFPATVYLEGTQVSEGRGTTKPFEILGAPYIDAKQLTESLNELQLPGVIFRQTNFLPTFQKHQKIVCGGTFLHISDRKTFKPVITGLAIIQNLIELFPNDFKWKTPPYEYEYDRNPFDVIAGTVKIREMLENGSGLEEIENSWREDLESFDILRKNYLIY